MKDKTLIFRIKQHEHKAFQELYDSCFISLQHYAMRYVYDRDQAEDLVQEAFYSFWINIDRYDENKDPQPYLLVIVKNQCLNYLRKVKIRDEHKDKILESLIFSGVEDNSIDADLQSRLEAILSEIPQKQKDVLIKHVLERQKFKDIACEMGISTETAKTHYKRVLKRLRANFFFILLGL